MNGRAHLRLHLRLHVRPSRAARAAAAVFSLLSAAVAAQTAMPASPQSFRHGLFTDVSVYAPAAGVRQVVLLLSGSDGPDAADRQRAAALAGQGALVALIDTPAFASRLDGEGGTCGYPAGPFENLSRVLQASRQLPGYRPPILVGRAAGGALAYAALAQAEPGTFAGALSVGFCPVLPFRQPVCGQRALPPSTPASAPSVFAAASATWASRSSALAPASRLPAPWVVVQPAEAARACAGSDAKAFVAKAEGAVYRALAKRDPLSPAVDNAYAEIAARAKAPSPPAGALADLPTIDVPSVRPGSRYAILVSGDGGWAAIDKELAAALARRGVPVAGLDSLRYFWRARTPEGLARDIDRLARHYSAHWGRHELVLIGFSQGADVLPFALNRLAPDTRQRLKLSVLISPGQKASFEFKVSNWLGPSGTMPIAPEALKLDAAATLCINGRDDRESLCPSLVPTHARGVTLGGNHHLDGDYDKLGHIIVSNVP